MHWSGLSSPAVGPGCSMLILDRVEWQQLFAKSGKIHLMLMAKSQRNVFLCTQHFGFNPTRFYLFIIFYPIVHCSQACDHPEWCPRLAHLAYLSTFNIAECYGLFEPAGSALAHDIEMAVVTR